MTESNGGGVKRIELETKLNEGRNWLLNIYAGLSDEQLRRPVTPSEHDSANTWTPLDHLAHLALIEGNFEQMVRRHLAGHPNPVGLRTDGQGQPRTIEEIMATVHAMTEKFQLEHRDDTLSEVVALTGDARSATLRLLSELTDTQLDEPLPGAPWADGTIGGVLGANADHGRSHWKWVTDTGLLDG